MELPFKKVTIIKKTIKNKNKEQTFHVIITLVQRFLHHCMTSALHYMILQVCVFEYACLCVAAIHSGNPLLSTPQ